MEKKKYYTVYKIVNKLNNMIYIGCHVTEKLKDSYMGSGTAIKKAIKQYGMENFEKYILYCFDNEIDMLNKEAEIVNLEFISKVDNYNIILGGGKFLTIDTVPVRDKDGNYCRVHKTDPRYLSGDLVFNLTGFVVVKDKDNNNLCVKLDDPRYLSGELVFSLTGFVCMRDSFGEVVRVKKDDPRYLSGELLPLNKGLILVKDRFENYTFVKSDDPRYLSGELIFSWVGKKHKEETKKLIGKKNSIHQKGEKNSQFGTCWINDGIKSIKIKKDDIENYLRDGWIKGRINVFKK